MLNQTYIAQSAFLWLVMGYGYAIIEVLWRGHTHWTMLIVGGLCGMLAGSLDRLPGIGTMSVLARCLIGTMITLSVELASGCILNRWLKLGVWDYTGKPFAILGQVCPQYGIAWFFLMPLAMWSADMLRYMVWRDGAPYHLWQIYFALLTGK